MHKKSCFIGNRIVKLVQVEFVEPKLQNRRYPPMYTKNFKTHYNGCLRTFCVMGYID